MTDDPDPEPVCRVIHLDEHRVWLDQDPDDELDDDDIARHPAARKHWT